MPSQASSELRESAPSPNGLHVITKISIYSINKKSHFLQNFGKNNEIFLKKLYFFHKIPRGALFFPIEFSSDFRYDDI